MTTLETIRPSITDQDYLDKLYDMGIFEKKLDVWAYCAAYALGKDLAPSDNRGPQMGSELDHLDKDMRDTLRAALLSKTRETVASEELVKQLSAYASAGIIDIRRRTEGMGRTEIYELLLGQVE